MRAFFLTAFVVFLTAGGTVYIVNPANIKGKTAVSLLPSEGKVIQIGTKNRNLRALKFAHLRKIKKPNLIFFGSSRIMNINSHVFRNDIRFFNLSAEGQQYTDPIAFWQTLVNLKKTPEYAVIFVDAWMFNKKDTRKKNFLSLPQFNVFVDRYQTPLEFARRKISRKMDSLSDAALNLMFKLRLFFSWDLLLRSLQLAFFTKETGSIQMLDEDKVPAGMIVYANDGSTTFHTVLAPGIKEKIREYPSNSGLSPWESDPEALHWMDMLLKDMQKKSVKILVVDPFYNPAVEKLLQQKSEYRFGIEKSKEHLAELIKLNPAVSFCGNFSPGDVGCSESEFVDALHTLPSCGKKVIDYCFSKEESWHQLLAPDLLEKSH